MPSEAEGEGEGAPGVSPSWLAWRESLRHENGGVLRSNFALAAASERAAGVLVEWARGYAPARAEATAALLAAAGRLAARLGVPAPGTDAHVEHLESEYLGPRALALWFSRPDEDNWFSFDAITALCEKLCERRGQHLALVGGVCTRDALPLVVDATEGLITAFTLALAD